jgi:hypothetical protein
MYYTETFPLYRSILRYDCIRVVCRAVRPVYDECGYKNALVCVLCRFGTNMRLVLVFEPEGSRGFGHKSGLLWPGLYTYHIELYTVRMRSKTVCFGSDPKCIEN